MQGCVERLNLEGDVGNRPGKDVEIVRESRCEEVQIESDAGTVKFVGSRC
jgi:hypothetical protein